MIHSTTKPVRLGPYNLPEQTHILPFLTDVMMNPESFPDPDQFIPERFINDEGEFVPHQEVITYGIGKRRCPGK